MTDSIPLVSIIVLNYNAGELLFNCLESLSKTKYENFEIILVDNNSSDQSHLKSKNLFPAINLIQNKKNFGYCEGNNIGIRQAKGDFVVILNPDTILEPNWLSEMIVAYNKFGDGLYQPKILSLYEKDILQSTGNMLHLFGFGFARDKGIKDDNSRDKIEQVGFASGTCLFTTSTILKKLEGLDSFLFLYHDDLDLGWRAAQLGINSYYVPKSIIYHAESYILKWSSKKFFWLERNRKYCLKTHYSKNTIKKISLILFQVDLLVWIFYIKKGFLFAKIKAELEIFKHRKFIKQRYDELENKKIISDSELIQKFPDILSVPENVIGSNISKKLNSIIGNLSKKAKKSILTND